MESVFLTPFHELRLNFDIKEFCLVLFVMGVELELFDMEHCSSNIDISSAGIESGSVCNVNQTSTLIKTVMKIFEMHKPVFSTKRKKKFATDGMYVLTGLINNSSSTNYLGGTRLKTVNRYLCSFLI